MYKLVIVDDESRVRRGLKNCINWQSLNITVVGEAEDGKEAIDSIMSLKPDIVLTDIMMPDIDGINLIKTIRELQIECQFIIISGYDDFKFARQAIIYDVYDYILKPINDLEVYDAVKRCINKFEKSSLEDDSININNQLVYNAILYINQNYNKDINLNDVADHLHLHPNYFSNLFSKVTGSSFSRYLAKLRVSKAKELIKNPSLKIYEISDMVGYKEYRQFCKNFKKYEGITPLDYRNNLVNDT